ncbi:MAG: adenylosuccinate synthase [Vicinamibacteria bacterium]|nr:adenylosuccinate synthase [Vicinamibacteria bacterium]
MPNIVVVGTQWGDEGKGKIVDLLTGRVQVVARYNGGHNAGHTVIANGRKFALRLIPSGILHEGVLCLMGPGMVVEPEAFETETEGLREAGVEVADNLLVSDRAHVILPHHFELEKLWEERRKIGTTRRGIGPAYEDKAGRRGIRLGDLLRPAALPEKLALARDHYEMVCRGAGVAPAVDWAALVDRLAAFGEHHRSRIVDVAMVLHAQLARGYSVLCEGAQATLLDLDHGTYPFVTSSSASAGGAAVGLGLAPTRIDAVLGIAKAYTTRVGSGPFPTEMGGELEEKVREKGGEYGVVTRRPRRCGWFDGVATRYSVRVNGVDSLAIIKLDVLDELDEIRVCTSYRHAGVTVDAMPADVEMLAECEPVYETLPGWKSQTAGLREFADLPQAAKDYVTRLGEIVGAEVGLVSTGPDRDDTILIGRSALATWFA